jgi:hypothetical protein
MGLGVRNRAFIAGNPVVYGRQYSGISKTLPGLTPQVSEWRSLIVADTPAWKRAFLWRIYKWWSSCGSA